jgi:hypothetical protein
MAAKPHARATVNHQAVQRVKAKLAERAKGARPHRVTVGIHEPDGAKPKLDYNGKETAIPLVTVAAAHELGRGVKERSWLRTWFDARRAQLADDMIKAMRQEYEGDTGAIHRQAEAWAADLRDWIDTEAGALPALEPSTVAAKERAGLAQPSTPLFATGELVAAIKSMLDGG